MTCDTRIYGLILHQRWEKLILKFSGTQNEDTRFTHLNFSVQGNSGKFFSREWGEFILPLVNFLISLARQQRLGCYQIFSFIIIVILFTAACCRIFVRVGEETPAKRTILSTRRKIHVIWWNFKPGQSCRGHFFGRKEIESNMASIRRTIAIRPVRHYVHSPFLFMFFFFRPEPQARNLHSQGSWILSQWPKKPSYLNWNHQDRGPRGLQG